MGICCACGTHQPQAKPELSSFQRQIIPAAKARALYFNLAYADSLSTNEIKAVHINQIAVPYSLRQKQQAGVIEVFIPEKSTDPEVEMPEGEGYNNIALYTQLASATAFSAVVYLSQGDSLLYPQLSEIEQDHLLE